MSKILIDQKKKKQLRKITNNGILLKKTTFSESHLFGFPYENSRRNPPGIQAVSKRKGHGFEKILA